MHFVACANLFQSEFLKIILNYLEFKNLNKYC